MGLFGKKKLKTKQRKQDIEPEKTSLYILIDAPKIGIVQYMRENGIEIKGIFYDIVDANYSFMQEDGASRILVIDTGTGIFSKVDNRAEIVSLLGMCIDNKRGMLFYTDPALKTTVSKTMPKTKVLKYGGTLSVVKALKEYNEEYCYDGAEDEVVDELLQFKGEQVNYEVLIQDVNTVKVEDGIIGDKEDTIKTFKVKY